jgi:hypothetical protein
MHTESIIKLIGHRPVYRVERDRVPALRAFEERLERILHRTPVIERNQWNRPMAGSDISNPAAGWFPECPDSAGAGL